MNSNHENKSAIILLERGIGLIENFEDRFVPYNTKFLGISNDGEFIINGVNTKDVESKTLNEFCFGRDGDYGESHLLHVYQMPNGKKYSIIERSISVYAVWEILD